MKIANKFIFSLLILLSSCQEETDYTMPLILTGEVTNITEEGVTLNAKISHLPEANIMEYGFEISSGEIPSSTKGKIVIEERLEKGFVSYNLNSGLLKNNTYHIRSFIKTQDRTIYGNPVSFTGMGSRPPEIKDFYPKGGPVGTKVTIEGNNFGYIKDETVLQFGGRRVEIDSLTNTKIFATLSGFNKNEEVKIAVITAGHRALSKELFSLWFPWTKLTDNNNNYWSETHFQINDRGYMIYSKKLHRFNLEQKTWEESVDIPADCGTGISSAVAGEKAYVLFNNGFWEFNPDANQWVRKENPPKSINYFDYIDFHYQEQYKPFLTTVGNRILFVSFNNNIWEFDSMNNTWTELQNSMKFTGNPTGSFAAVTDEEIYFGFNKETGSEFWRFDPADLQWNPLGTLPVNSYSYWGTAILHNKLYLGFGGNDEWPSQSSDQMWEYNAAQNSWYQFHSCPEKSIVFASFSYNNKAYFITPWTTWEFDPLRN